MKVSITDLEKDPIRQMNWKKTSVLKKYAYYNPTARYNLNCRANKMYPADTKGELIHDWSNDYEC